MEYRRRHVQYFFNELDTSENDSVDSFEKQLNYYQHPFYVLKFIFLFVCILFILYSCNQYDISINAVDRVQQYQDTILDLMAFF